MKYKLGLNIGQEKRIEKPIAPFRAYIIEETQL